MATKNTAAVLDEELEATEAEVTEKQIISDGIVSVVEATGIDVQKSRYKAMRAIAFQAFVEAIENDDFEGLVERAIINVDALPTGWEIEKPAKEDAPAKAKKPAAKKTAAAKAPAKAPRRRPRSAA